MNNPISKIDRGLSLSEKTEQQVFEAIRQKIFLPGDKLLGEIELAENFGVSRTVVREALHRLAGRGILEARKGSGFYVAVDQFSFVTNSLYHLLELKCGSSSLLNIVDVRLVIEPEIARMAAANRTKEDLKVLKRSCSNMENHINDPQQMIRYDIDFHHTLAISSKNPIFPVIMEPLFQIMGKFISETYEYPTSPVLALKSHNKLFTCIEAGDSEGAYHAMHTHMSEAKDHAINILKQETPR